MNLARTWIAVLVVAVLGALLQDRAWAQSSAAKATPDKLLSNGAGCDGPVQALLQAEDGTVYLGGQFSTCGGIPAANVVAYDPLTARFRALGDGVVGSVSALAYFDGELYVAGLVRSAGGEGSNKVARWNGSRWIAMGSALGLPGNFDFGGVDDLEVFRGHLYAAGSFTSIGASSSRYLARWDGSSWVEADSALFYNSVFGGVYALAVYQDELYAAGNLRGNTDQGFVNNIARFDGSRWRPVGAGILPSEPSILLGVRALAVHQGALYVGGSFSDAGGTPAAGFARWDGSGWSAVGGGIASGTIRSLASFADALIVGGDFEVRQNGQSIRRLARWDGQSWTRPGVSGGDTVDASVRALLATQSLLYVGGDFVTVDGIGFNHVARWNGRDWQALDRSTSQGIIGYTAAIATTADAAFVGGNFAVAGGVAVRNIARWNGSAWSALRGPGGDGVNSLVTTIAVAGTDVYVGGYFTEAAGITANRIARWDGSRWHSLGDAAGNGLDGPVYAINIGDDGVYVSGAFQHAGGQPARHVAVWRDGRWSAFGAGPELPVHVLAMSGSTLYAGGGLSPASGTAQTAVYQWNGQSWTQIYANGGGPLEALVMYQGRPHIAYANAVLAWDGSAWQPLREDDGATHIIPLDLVTHRSQLYVSGYFSSVTADVPATRRARWDGSQWLPFWTEQPQRKTFRKLASDGNTLVDIDSDGLIASPRPTLQSVAVNASSTNGVSSTPVIARNGVRLAFGSTASDLVSTGARGRSDIYLRDPTSGQTDRVSALIADLQPGASEDYSEPTLSADGASIAFTGSGGQIWGVIHGVPRLLSSNQAGVPANGPSQRPMLAGRGRYLVFESRADNLLGVADGNGAVGDIFRKDLDTGTVTLISTGVAGVAANGTSSAPWASDDGRNVAFISSAANLTATPGNGIPQAFLLRDDAAAPMRELLSRNLSSGRAGNGPSSDVRITPDGRFGVFASTASNLVADDGNNASDVYFFEMDSNGIQRLERLSVSIYGEEGNAGSYSPSISDDGRLVTFATDASNLVELDRNGQRDVLIKDTQTRNVQRLSRSADGMQPDGASEQAMIAGDGSIIVFRSSARNLVLADNEADPDIYSASLLERTPPAIDTPLDEPGVKHFALPAPQPANVQCPAGFFVATISDGPGIGITPGLFGMELLLDEPGTRTLAGGLNFGGTADVDQAGFAGFNIANAANEPQRLNLRVTGNAIGDSQSGLPVRIRIARRTASSSETEFETTTTLSRAQPFLTSVVLQPAFYEATVTPLQGSPRGDADGEFFFEATTSFVDRPGGGFQGGAVVGGYHSAAPNNGASGFAGFCLATPHTISVRVLARPSYGTDGARDLRLRLLDSQLRAMVALPQD